MNIARHGVRRRVCALKRRRVADFATHREVQSGDTSPHSKGFSLIEVMVAVLILGVSLVGLVHGINTALVSGKESEIQSQAALLAAGQIELLRADGYYLEGETSGEFDGDLSVYSWRQNVAAIEPEGLYEVTVTIENTQSGEEIFELKTLLFDPPLTTEETETQKKERERKKGRL
jgi:prepilin-type N-terminal cleavage/methylation domain-containing protein